MNLTPLGTRIFHLYFSLHITMALWHASHIGSHYWFIRLSTLEWMSLRLPIWRSTIKQYDSMSQSQKDLEYDQDARIIKPPISHK